MKKDNKVPFKKGQLEVMEKILKNRGSVSRGHVMKLVQFAKSFVEDEDKLDEIILDRGSEAQVKQVEKKLKKKKAEAKSEKPEE